MEILDIVALVSAMVTIVARLVYIHSQYSSSNRHNKKYGLATLF